MTTIAKQFSLPLEDDLVLSQRIEAGIPAATINLLRKALGIGSIASVAALVNMSAKTAERRVQSKAVLSPTESERVVRLIRILHLAGEVFESDDAARAWMNKPLKIFGGKTPLKMCATEPGTRAVEQALGRIEHSVFA